VSHLEQTIGRVWDEVADLDWSGWYPLVQMRGDELIVVGLLEADREDLSDLIPIARGGVCGAFACEPGDQDGFMLASEYHRLFDEQTGGER
jgi:hypothetical protein